MNKYIKAYILNIYIYLENNRPVNNSIIAERLFYRTFSQGQFAAPKYGEESEEVCLKLEKIFL